MKTTKEQKEIINKFGEISKFLINDIFFTGEDDKGNKRYHLWKLLDFENILKYKKENIENYMGLYLAIAYFCKEYHNNIKIKKIISILINNGVTFGNGNIFCYLR